MDNDFVEKDKNKKTVIYSFVYFFSTKRNNHRQGRNTAAVRIP